MTKSFHAETSTSAMAVFQRPRSALLFCLLTFAWDVLPQPLPARQHLYPYGPGMGDTTAPVNDDGSTRRLPIGTRFPYFDEWHTSLFVNTNGLLSFLGPVSQFTPDPFPLDGDRRLVAAFWADVDTGRNGGRVYYRESLDSALLQRATDDVRQAFVTLTHFSAIWAFISSWHEVTFFGGGGNTPVNTFQIVLVTNGRHSFAIFNYGEILWTSGTASGGNDTGLGGIPAQAGFNAGDGVRFFSVPGSREASIVDVEETSNVGLPGRWIFRVDSAEVEAGGCNTHGSLAVGPRFGSMLGGAAFIVSGPCFDVASAATDLVCRFADLVSPAVVLDATRAKCVLPMTLRTGRVPVALSLDGGANYNHTSMFTLVAELQQGIFMINIGSIRRGDFRNTLQVAWPPQFFNSSKVDVDFVVFRYEYGANQTSVAFSVVPIARNVTNIGAFVLPSALPLADSLARLHGAVGALRLRQSSYSGPLDTFLWSEIHIAEWYLNMYSKQLALNAESSASSASSASTPNRRTKRNALTDAIAEAGLLYAQKCDDWYQNEQRDVPPAQGLSPCPCTMQQAGVDDRFTTDTACHRGYIGSRFCAFYHNGATECIRSTSAGSLGGGMQCCYDEAGDILTAIEDGGGTFDRSHTDGHDGVGKVATISHLLDDVLPYFYCCKWSDSCAKYGEVRPTDDCKEYEPPLRATGFGDPHIITLDGLRYTFNGLGEFWLVRSANFAMQSRATVMTDDAGDPLKATAWTACVANTSASDVVQIQINTRTGFDILINGAQEDFEDLPTQQFNGVKVTYDAANVTAKVHFQSPEEYTLWVTASDDVMYFTLSWPNNAGSPLGLLGNANGDPDDDLQTANNVVLPSNATLKEIHEKFGLTWQTTEDESLFTYGAGLSHSSFKDSNFVPLFNLSLANRSYATRAEAASLCGLSNECLFDYLLTGKRSLAIASADAVLQHEEFINSSKLVVSCGYLAPPANGNRTGSSPLAGSVIKFACNERYRLEGSAERRCTDAGTWDGSQTTCIVSHCLPLEAPPNGSVSSDRSAIGSEITLACDSGFTLEGSTRRRCLSSGQWDGTNTACTESAAVTVSTVSTAGNGSTAPTVSCDRLLTPTDGTKSGDMSTTVGAVVTFACDARFRLTGSVRRECLASGAWSGSVTTCELRASTSSSYGTAGIVAVAVALVALTIAIVAAIFVLHKYKSSRKTGKESWRRPHFTLEQSVSPNSTSVLPPPFKHYHPFLKPPPRHFSPYYYNTDNQ